MSLWLTLLVSKLWIFNKYLIESGLFCDWGIAESKTNYSYVYNLLAADEIGVAVVPYNDLEKVYKAARELADNEIATREEILKGATEEELLAKFGRI